MRSAILFLGVAALASAQSSNLTSCCNVDPGTVDPNQRLAWCRAQRNTCPELCTNGQTTANDCDSDKLTYTCTCLTGAAPNISDYGQTLPSLECDEWKTQCIKAHPNDLSGQTFCLGFTCGTRNATKVGAGAGSNTGGSATSSSSGSSSSSTSSSAPAASSSKSAATMLNIGREYGTAGVLMGVLGLITYAL